jgi:hypothetical protein
MLRDAMIQERISGRIHDEERRVSLVEVEPTPEVTVGSLQPHLPGDQSELERISDDAEGTVDNTTLVTEVVALSEEIPVSAEAVEDFSRS